MLNPIDGATIDDPYDRGYWRRYLGKPRPSGRQRDRDARRGWDECNAELEAEATSAAREAGEK